VLLLGLDELAHQRAHAQRLVLKGAQLGLRQGVVERGQGDAAHDPQLRHVAFLGRLLRLADEGRIVGRVGGNAEQAQGRCQVRAVGLAVEIERAARRLCNGRIEQGMAMVRGQAEEIGIAWRGAQIVEVRRDRSDPAAPHGCEATEIAGLDRHALRRPDGWRNLDPVGDRFRHNISFMKTLAERCRQSTGGCGRLLAGNSDCRSKLPPF